jgi:hypothetical protein
MAEAASSSLFVPAIFSKVLQLGDCWHPHLHWQNAPNQLILGLPLHVACRHHILVLHAESAVTQVVMDR